VGVGTVVRIKNDVWEEGEEGHPSIVARQEKGEKKLSFL